MDEASALRYENAHKHEQTGVLFCLFCFVEIFLAAIYKVVWLQKSLMIIWEATRTAYKIEGMKKKIKISQRKIKISQRKY